jgi:hypothetical protein
MNTIPGPEVGSNSELRLTLLGVGAMNSPRYAPAGLLVEYGDCRIMLDGGGAAEPKERIDAWLVNDERSEALPGRRSSCNFPAGPLAST